ncbi:glycosyltransferase family 39 protein [bacterium]|nr:glycosyltransferase family 39 protein [bacterium]
MGSAKKNKSNKSKSPTGRYWGWIAISLIVLFIAIIRIRLLATPLERDEGEYAYMGQLMLQGIAPYKLACNMKFPGTYAAYAIIMAIFGQSISGVHLGLLLANAATIILMFLLGWRLFGQLAGVVAGATYGILSLSSSFLGQAGHATHFVVLAALGGTLLLLKAIDSGKRSHLFLSGLLFGLAILMKQSGVFFCVFAVVYLFFTWRKNGSANRRIRLLNLGILLLGIILPVGITFLILWCTGVFDKFWFWTFTYAREYSSQIPSSAAPGVFWSAITRAIGPGGVLWIISGFGLIALLLDRNARSKAGFVVLFLVCAFLTVCPGFYFRNHYFIQFIPALSLLAGVAVSSCRRMLYTSKVPKVISVLPVVIFIAAFAYTVDCQKDVFFTLSPDQVCSKTYTINPFPEAVKIADYIKRHTDKNDTIAVIGSEPEIYFYSGRHSATSYIYTYSLMEEQKYASDMQRDMIGEIDEAKPKFIVLVKIPTSWLASAESDRLIFDWSSRYVYDHYDPVGVADITPEDTEYVWGADLLNYSLKSSYNVVVFKRKGTTY